MSSSPPDVTAAPKPELVLLSTDRGSGAVTCAVALGDAWEQVVCDLVRDAGRRPREGAGA